MENENNIKKAENSIHTEAQDELQWSRRKIKITFSVLGIIVVLLGCGFAYFYYQSKIADNNEKILAQSKNELVTTIEAVGKLIFLPIDEEPMLATVSDPEKLRDQTFFASAVKGDKVLIYTKARKAILYNPSKNKIIEVAPINLNSTPKTDTVGATPGITP